MITAGTYTATGVAMFLLAALVVISLVIVKLEDIQLYVVEWWSYIGLAIFLLLFAVAFIWIGFTV